MNCKSQRGDTTIIMASLAFRDRIGILKKNDEQIETSKIEILFYIVSDQWFSTFRNINELINSIATNACNANVILETSAQLMLHF